MGGRAPRFTIILAAGKGTRMGSTTQHKVCFPIDGQPAINRALNIYTNLTEQYYRPHNKPPSVLVCRPVAGSDVLLRDLR